MASVCCGFVGNGDDSGNWRRALIRTKKTPSPLSTASARHLQRSVNRLDDFFIQCKLMV